MRASCAHEVSHVLCGHTSIHAELGPFGWIGRRIRRRELAAGIDRHADEVEADLTACQLVGSDSVLAWLREKESRGNGRRPSWSHPSNALRQAAVKAFAPDTDIPRAIAQAFIAEQARA